MDPFEYLRILRRRWPIVLGATLIALVGAWLTLPDPPAPQEPGQLQVQESDQYRAQHVLFRQSMGGDRGPSNGMLALLATTDPVTQRVAEQLGEEWSPQLGTQVQVQADENLSSITISTVQEDPERAEVLVDTFAEIMIAHFSANLEQQRQARLERLHERREELAAEIDELGRGLPTDGQENPSTATRRSQFNQKVAAHGNTVAEIESLETQGPATIGLESFQTGSAAPVIQEERGFQPPASPTMRLPLAALVGLALGLGLAVMVDRVDSRLDGRTAVEEAFGLPVVAEIPKLKAAERRNHGIVALTHPGSYAAEAFRVLRLSVQLMPRWVLPVRDPSRQHETERLTPAQGRLGSTRSDDPARVVLVTSPTAGDGKSTTIVNLAATFAEVGKAVLVLDCDFRFPKAHRFFGVEPEPGVAEYLQSGKHRPSLARIAKETSVKGVWVVPNGAPPANPGELIGPDQDLIAEAVELADVVLVDTGPLLAVNDPAALVPHTDAVIVVARSGKTDADDAARTSELLARLKAPVLGVALVGSTRGKRSYRYYTSHSSRVLGHTGLDEELRPLPKDPR